MAKKDKKRKDKKGSGAQDPVEAVRSAVERRLKTTGEGAGKRGRDLVDEVAHAAARFRDAMGDLKVLDDLKAEVARLSERVAKLEGGAAKPAAARRTSTRSATSRSTAAKSSGTTASRSRSTASKPAAKKPAASSRARSTGTRSTGTRSTGARSTGTRSTGTRSTRSRSSGSSS
jgi:DNA topoisomerase-1